MKNEKKTRFNTIVWFLIYSRNVFRMSFLLIGSAYIHTNRTTIIAYYIIYNMCIPNIRIYYTDIHTYRSYFSKKKSFFYTVLHMILHRNILKYLFGYRYVLSIFWIILKSIFHKYKYLINLYSIIINEYHAVLSNFPIFSSLPLYEYNDQNTVHWMHFIFTYEWH